MDHVMSNFGSIKYEAKLAVKVSLLETENFELRCQLVDKLLMIKQSKTQIQENLFPTNVSTTTNKVITSAQTNDNIDSNNDNNNNISNNNCKKKNNGNNNNNENKKNNSSTKEKAVCNEKLQAQLQEIRKERQNIFQIFKRIKSRQTKLVYHKEINQTEVSILPTLIIKLQM